MGRPPVVRHRGPRAQSWRDGGGLSLRISCAIQSGAYRARPAESSSRMRNSLHVVVCNRKAHPRPRLATQGRHAFAVAKGDEPVLAPRDSGPARRGSLGDPRFRSRAVSGRLCLHRWRQGCQGAPQARSGQRVASAAMACNASITHTNSSILPCSYNSWRLSGPHFPRRCRDCASRVDDGHVLAHNWRMTSCF